MDDAEGMTIGPTGPDETWQGGDIMLRGIVPIRLNQEQADEINRRTQRCKMLAATVELTRPVYQPVTTCPKCRLTIDHDTVWRGPDADCAHWHGKTEHMDRQCIRCEHIWSESMPPGTPLTESHHDEDVE